MILKIIAKKESKSHETDYIHYFEGDDIRCFPNNTPEPDGEIPTMTGCRVLVSKQKKDVYQNFYSHEDIQRSSLTAYLMNDEGKTVSRLIPQ